MLNIVTGNITKFESAKKYLSVYGIEVKHVKLNMVEPQGEAIEIIAQYKANQAFSILHKPIAITDAGWEFPALNGFPGPYMHSIMS